MDSDYFNQFQQQSQDLSAKELQAVNQCSSTFLSDPSDPYSSYHPLFPLHKVPQEKLDLVYKKKIYSQFIRKYKSISIRQKPLPLPKTKPKLQAKSKINYLKHALMQKNNWKLIVQRPIDVVRKAKMIGNCAHRLQFHSKRQKGERKHQLILQALRAKLAAIQILDRS